MKSFTLFISASLAFSVWSCTGVEPAKPALHEERLVTGPGPEDMVLDTLHGEARLILSCTARREDQDPFGEIMSLNPDNGSETALIRYGEPEGMVFRPHGIYLDGDRLLVINHEREPDLHPILIYMIHGDSLELTDRIISPSQHSPNALVTGNNGVIYFVNDSGKRGSLIEKALKLRRASLVKLVKDSDGNWEPEILAENLAYPAGINRLGDTLYVGDAVLHRIHRFTLSGESLEAGKMIRGVRGADNIRIHEGQLIVPGHVKPLRFIGHTKDPGKLSPVAVFSIDPVSGRSTTLYYTDGSSISAGSTALVFGEYLYISQIFEPYILKVRLPE